MIGWRIFVVPVCVLMFMTVYQSVDAQENLAQDAYAIFEGNCLICHGEHGAHTEQLVIQSSQALINTGTVIPGNPDDSEFYQRLIETAVERRMPLGQPPLAPEAIETIRQWIQAGAPDWNAFPRSDTNFITPDEMLEAIENHLQSLDAFDRSYARYFTSTHLYNAGETIETLRAYRRALSKLVNSLSWGREVNNPQPIDTQETIFYIDLRDYEWEIGINRWTQIEQEYPYKNNFESATQTHLHEKLMNLRQEMNCEVPFVHIDWFLANASLPPLYHDILDLPLTDRDLEARLEVDVVQNIRNAPGVSASGVPVSTTPVFQITTALLNGTFRDMGRIGKVTILRGVWEIRISLHIRSLSRMTAARSSSTSRTVCRHTISQMRAAIGWMKHR